jgi:hypothetical protein
MIENEVVCGNKSNRLSPCCSSLTWRFDISSLVSKLQQHMVNQAEHETVTKVSVDIALHRPMHRKIFNGVHGNCKFFSYRA